MNRLAVIRSVFVLVIGLIAHTAHAGVINVEFDGFSQGRTTVYQTLDGNNMNALAGMYDMSVISANNVDDWLSEQSEIQAFCVELDQYLTTSGSVEYTVMAGADFFQDAQTLDKIGRLYTGFFQSVLAQTEDKQKRIYSTAFQLALWDLVYDAATPNLLEDRYQMRADKNGTVRAKANEFLNGLANFENQFSLFVLQSDTSQDLLIVNPVPPRLVSEPSTLAAFVLMALVFVRRKA